MDIPSFKEEHISQIPALQLLIKMGYKYLTPQAALEARSNRSSNVLLESILKKQLLQINKIEENLLSYKILFRIWFYCNRKEIFGR